MRDVHQPACHPMPAPCWLQIWLWVLILSVQKTNPLNNVGESQPAICLDRVWIECDCLIEVVNALVESVFGEFGRVVIAHEVKLVRFRVSVEP